LKIFGEACVKKVRKGLQVKLENKGDLCFFYHDTFRLFNLDTNKVVESRDARWLNQIQRKEGEDLGLEAVLSDPNEPNTFNQAWNHVNLTERDEALEND
jgi:hypothetical protein